MENQTSKGKAFAKAYEKFIKSGRTCVGFIPILEDAELRPGARVLFHIISSFSYVEGFCFATRETLANHLGLKKTMVKQYLKELESKDLIEIKLYPELGNRSEIYVRFDTLGNRYRDK
jgi:hypothetical protein